MTKKDYELIAQALHRSKPRENALTSETRTWEDIVFAMAMALLKQNPRFKELAFLKACNEGINK